MGPKFKEKLISFIYIFHTWNEANFIFLLFFSWRKMFLMWDFLPVALCQTQFHVLVDFQFSDEGCWKPIVPLKKYLLDWNMSGCLQLITWIAIDFVCLLYSFWDYLLYFIFFNIYFYLKSRLTDRDLSPPAGSIPKWRQWPELRQSEARNQEQLLSLPHGAGCQGLQPSSAAFQGHRQGAELEVGRLGLEPGPVWDAGTARQNNSLLSHYAKHSEIIC